MLRPISSILAVLALASCGGGEAEELEPCTTSDQPSYVLGTDQARRAPFAPLEDEQPLQLIRGAQDGCHLPLAFQTTGFDRSLARIQYRLTDVDSGESYGEMTVTANLNPGDGAPERCEVVNFRAFFLEPWKAENHRVRVETSVQDLRGFAAWRTVIVRVQWPDEVPAIDREKLCGSPG